MTDRPARWFNRTGPLLLIGLLLPRPATAQQSPSMHAMLHTSWGTKDGIPVGGVFRMASTPDGYLWLSANGGLLRFDGLRFTLVDSSTVPALRSSEAGEFRPLLVDRDGTMWLTRSDDALVAYHAGEFTEVLPAIPGFPRGRMAQDRVGTIWAVSGDAWRVQRFRDGQLLPAELPAQVPDTGILGIVPDTGAGLWLGTRMQGLWHVNGDRVDHYPHPCKDLTIRPLLQSRDGRLWATCDGLKYLDRSGWHLATLPGIGSRFQPTAAIQGADGMVWVATRGRGLLRWDGREFEVFSEADGLSDGIVHEVWLDAEGVVWATTDGGLDRLRSAPFITIDRGLGLPFDSPQSIHYGAEGSVWAYAYDERRHFRLDGGLIRKQPGPIRSIDPLLSRHPELIVYGVAHDGGLWATIGKRLFHYREGVFSPPGGIPLPPGDDLVYQVLEDSRGRLWVEMTESGLFLRRPGESRLTPVWNRTSQRSTFGIHLDSREQLWLGLDQPPEVAVFRDTVLLRQLDSSNGLTSAPHVAVTEAGDTTWGYVGGGRLMRIIGNKVTILRNPDVRNLLRTASIALMVEGDYLWLASEGGVTRISLAQLHRAADGDTETVPVRVFDELDGLKVAKLTTLSRFPAFKAADGRLWFSTPAGLAVVDPASITPNPRPPLPHIEELVAAGRVIPQSRRLQIAPNPPRVEIHYTATGLVVPERATIEYRLDGIDHDWVRSGKERMVSYAGLRPRHYTFRVRAWNEDGIPGVAEATLVFRVLPFWYQTWWFLGILLLLVASAGGLVFYAVQRARAKAAAARMRARFEATLAERTRLARELHDTLLQGFTGITLELQAMQRSMIEAPREAAITLARVLTTSDATLREARQMVWDMRAPELDHHDLAEALESAARQATADTPIALDVVIEGIRRRLDIGIETTALRIGREAVVNAVKHAEPTAITISLSFAEKRVSLVVKDNGRGCDAQMLEEAVAGGHWGIRGMQERAARSGGTLDIRGGPGSGTEVALVLPLTS